MKADVGADNVMYIHTTLLPYLKAAGEMKTKPTQHSVKNCVVWESIKYVGHSYRKPAGQGIQNKLAQFCDVAPEAVIESLDVGTSLPNSIELAGAKVWTKLSVTIWKLDAPVADMTEWSAMVDKVMNLKKQVKISLVGKYVELQDAYISVVEALETLWLCQ